MADKKPAAVSDHPFEAMAAELNMRGGPFIYCGLEFPPGMWVPVTEQQATKLGWFDAITVRPRKDT